MALSRRRKKTKVTQPRSPIPSGVVIAPDLVPTIERISRRTSLRRRSRMTQKRSESRFVLVGDTSRWVV